MATANYDLNLDGKWLFHYGDFSKIQNLPIDEYHASSKTGGALKHIADFSHPESWREVHTPHDWLTELQIDETQDAAQGCKRREMAWYKRSFSLPDIPIESAKLVFDGVLGQSTVFVNGVLAARNFSGYNRFSVEIGDYLLPGEENEIALFVDARRHEGWWYEGAGLYRPVHLYFREYAHIVREDCFIRTVGDAVIADVSLTGCGKVIAELCDKFGVKLASFELDGNIGTSSFSFEIDSPLRWSPEHPYLYTLAIALEKEGREIDRAIFQVGFRDIEWVADEGMHLDGKPYRIKGICAHQDHAGLGAAVCDEVEEYRIMRIKSLGANAYRSAHHAPTESLLDICDRLGILVMVENRHFDISKSTLEELDSLVKLSRNHPCVFLYGMFNEEPWQSEPRGKRIITKLRDSVQRLDKTRAVTAAQNGGVLLQNNASEAIEVIGMNYNLNAYRECHVLSPEKTILGTENSPTFATRGTYRTCRAAQVFADDGTEYPSDFSEPLCETMSAVENNSFVAGCFVWCAFDHRGEPNPFGYPSVFSHWGFLDSCGFDKNIANLLRAYYVDEPFLRFAVFGSLPDENTQKIIAFTNADNGELFLDGRSLGIKKAKNRTLVWEVPTGAKEMRIISAKDGRIISDVYRVPDKKARLSVTDVNPRGNLGNVRILNVSVVDETGTPILSENGLLTVSGEILGVGNGNPNGHQDDRATCFNIFNGMAQIITLREKEITVSYDGLEPVTIKN